MEINALVSYRSHRCDLAIPSCQLLRLYLAPNQCCLGIITLFLSAFILVSWKTNSFQTYHRNIGRIPKISSLKDYQEFFKIAIIKCRINNSPHLHRLDSISGLTSLHLSTHHNLPRLGNLPKFTDVSGEAEIQRYAIWLQKYGQDAGF